MWAVVEKVSTEASSATKGDALTYVAYSVWNDEASHGKAEPPIYQSDLLISAGLLPDNVTRFVRDELNNLMLQRGGFWTELQYIAQVRLYRLGLRANPNLDLATETVAVDLVEELKQKHILPHLERADAAGLLRGNRKSEVQDKSPAPEDKAEKAELKDLIGKGFEILLEREKAVKAEKDKAK